MNRLILVDSKKMENLLFSLGFSKVRQKGSHAFYRHSNGRTTTIPHHTGRLLSRPLISKILKDIEIPKDRYIQLIKDI